MVFLSFFAFLNIFKAFRRHRRYFLGLFGMSCKVSAKEPDCPPKSGLARIGRLVPVSVVMDEFGEVGDGIEVGDVEQKDVKLKSPITDMACR